MNLHRMMLERAAAGRPVRVGLIGAGKFGSMFLAQARTTLGLHVLAVADLSASRAQQALQRTGWLAEKFAAESIEAARRDGTTHVTDDPTAVLDAEGLDVVVEATGVPSVGIRHALAAIENGRHVVMVNVEADVLAGPLMARHAARRGVVYSLAYGDQPALICELVDWARAAGFEVVCAGKGTKYRPEYHASTPDTVWNYYGLTGEQAAAAGMNPQMFNSFLDGTKSAIEMAAVANATGLSPAAGGLTFPPCGTPDLARLLRPRTDGGRLDLKGTVEVISSEHRDGRPVPSDLRWGVYVTFEAAGDYTARCFGEYGISTGDDGRYAALYRPYHLIGLELGISIAAAALRAEPTGAPTGFRGDVVAVAKRDLGAGEVLDGEGGYTVWGRLMPAADSLAAAALPIGLATGCKLLRTVAAGTMIRRGDIALDETDETVRLRAEMEATFAPIGQEARRTVA